MHSIISQPLSPSSLSPIVPIASATHTYYEEARRVLQQRESGGLNLGLHYTRHSVTRLKYFVPRRPSFPSFISVSLARLAPSFTLPALSLFRARARPCTISGLVIFTLDLDFSYQDHLRRSLSLRERARWPYKITERTKVRCTGNSG